MRRYVAAVVAALVLLAGCQSTAGAAAIVNGERISDKQVAQVVSDLQVKQPQITPAAALHWLIAIKLLDPLAQRYDKVVSNDQAKEFLTDNQFTAAEIAALSQPTMEVIRAIMTNSQLASLPQAKENAAEIVATLTGPNVQVNPRYGAFDATGVLTVTTPAWIIHQ